MKNPYYEPAPAKSKKEDEDAEAFTAAQRYLQSDPSVETVSESKVRKSHPDLADDDTWARVKARLEKVHPAK